MSGSTAAIPIWITPFITLKKMIINDKKENFQVKRVKKVIMELIIVPRPVNRQRTAKTEQPIFTTRSFSVFFFGAEEYIFDWSSKRC